MKTSKWLILFLLLASLRAIAGIERTDTKESLRGLNGVYVVVQIIDEHPEGVTTSRFKEALTIYTDDKHQLLEAVSKSSHRPSAMDLVSKDISESPNEATIKKP